MKFAEGGVGAVWAKRGSKFLIKQNGISRRWHGAVWFQCGGGARGITLFDLNWLEFAGGGVGAVWAECGGGAGTAAGRFGRGTRRDVPDQRRHQQQPVHLHTCDALCHHWPPAGAASLAL